jgi:hypothetical protein
MVAKLDKRALAVRLFGRDRVVEAEQANVEKKEKTTDREGESESVEADEEIDEPVQNDNLESETVESNDINV